MATREADGNRPYTHAGTGNRRRVDQGVHLAARRAAAARAVHGAGASARSTPAQIRNHIEELLQMPQTLEHAIKASAVMEKVAERFYNRA